MTAVMPRVASFIVRLSVVMLGVIMLTVVTPKLHPQEFFDRDKKINFPNLSQLYLLSFLNVLLLLNLAI